MLSKEFLLNQSIQECLQSMTNEGINISQSINFCISKVLTAQQPDDHSNSTDHYALSHYHLSNYFEIAVEFIDSIAGLIVLFSVGLACLNLIIVGVNIILGSSYPLVDPIQLHSYSRCENTLQRIRIVLGEQIALALAILVASDILETVLKPLHAYDILDVVKMGFVTVLRTVLAYFLAKEIKELEESKTSRDRHSKERQQKQAEKETSLQVNEESTVNIQTSTSGQKQEGLRKRSKSQK